MKSLLFSSTDLAGFTPLSFGVSHTHAQRNHRKTADEAQRKQNMYAAYATALSSIE